MVTGVTKPRGSKTFPRLLATVRLERGKCADSRDMLLCSVSFSVLELLISKNDQFLSGKHVFSFPFFSSTSGASGLVRVSLERGKHEFSVGTPNFAVSFFEPEL